MHIPEIDAQSAKKKLDEGAALFVDIRDPQSYASGRIPGARPLGDDNVKDFLANSDKKKPVIVCCYHGHTSMGATAFLLENGFEDVRSLTGGFAQWSAQYPKDIEATEAVNYGRRNKME